MAGKMGLVDLNGEMEQLHKKLRQLHRKLPTLQRAGTVLHKTLLQQPNNFLCLQLQIVSVIGLSKLSLQQEFWFNNIVNACACSPR